MKRLRCSLGRSGKAGVSPRRNPRRIPLRGFFSRRLTSSGGGIPRPSRRWRKLATAACCGLLVAVAGCGESEGVAEGAIASVYAAAPLCAGAKHEAARHEDRAGDVHIHVICLPSGEHGKRLDLATIGASARRASQDSTTVGYIGEPTRAATRFSESILESVGIAQLSEGSGAEAMRKLSRAVDEAGDSGSLRESVNSELK